MVKTSCYLALLGFLLISPSSNAAESPVYVKITEVIRSVTLLDEAGAIIGKRFEKKDTKELIKIKSLHFSPGSLKFDIIPFIEEYEKIYGLPH